MDRDDPAGATQKDCTRGRLAADGAKARGADRPQERSKASEAALAIMFRKRPEPGDARNASLRVTSPVLPYLII